MSLVDNVLPLVRTRRDVHRWDAANDYGAGLHGAVGLLREAMQTEPATDVLQVTQKAIDIACKVIMRADDSSGIIGDAIHDLLELHAEAACAAPQPFRKLVDWMITFQFNNKCDFFQIDPVAYGPALGDVGMASYKARLDAFAADLGPEPTPEQLKSWALSSDRVEWARASRDRHAQFVLEWNARRLAVWDRDVPAIIATHQRDRKVAAWLHNTAKALAEIGEFDLAIDWASQATHFDLGHQAAGASDYWCALLAEHRPDEELDARLDVFRRWPTAGHAIGLQAAAGSQWPAYRDDVMAALTPQPNEAVSFALDGLKDVRLAWELANSLDLDDWRLWEAVAKKYEKIDRLAVLPLYSRRVRADLADANTRVYPSVARRLARMRKLAQGSEQASEVDALIADLREGYYRRPRMLEAFDRAGLP